MDRLKKRERQSQLKEKLNTTPFITDEELAELFGVSIPTIRLDRLALGIPELRERIKAMATENTHGSDDIENCGEIIDIIPGKEAISMVTTTEEMTDSFGYVEPQFLYGLANALAKKIIGIPAAITGVGNIKYKDPIKANKNLVARAEIVRQRGKKFFNWVIIKDKDKEVFRAKFILESIEDRV